MKRGLFLLLLVVGCKSSEGPTCAQVTDHMLEITKQVLTGHDAVQMGDRKAMIDTCEKRAYSAETRSCLVAAKTLDDLGRCRKTH